MAYIEKTPLSFGKLFEYEYQFSVIVEKDDERIENILSEVFDTAMNYLGKRLKQIGYKYEYGHIEKEE